MKARSRDGARACMTNDYLENVSDPIRDASVNRKQPMPKVLPRAFRVNIILKQFETLNILPIARDSGVCV